MRRAECRLLVWFGCENSSTSNAAITSNVSLEGLFIRTRLVQPVGQILTLQVDLAGYKMPLRGVVAWNRTDKDWINSPTSIDEVGSIHTVQGYDLNYAGVIIGPDLRLDPKSGEVRFHRESYFDRKGKENLTKLGRKVTDDELREFVINIYRVLLTRGILGTYVYVCDPALRDYVASRIASAARELGAT